MLRSAALRIIRALGVDRRLQRAVRTGSALPPLRGHRGQSARQPLVGAGVEGDGLSDRPRHGQDRRSASACTRSRTPSPSETTAAFEPALDYLVVKIPRWPFDKFPDGDRRLGTQMKSTGEAMAIERSFEAALQKAVRSLEVAQPRPAVGGPVLVARGPRAPDPLSPTTSVSWALMAALRRGRPAETLSAWSGIDAFFLDKLANLVEAERRAAPTPRADASAGAACQTARLLRSSDRRCCVDELPERVRDRRRDWDIRPTYKMVDTCAAEFEAVTPYFYGTYETENEASRCSRRRRSSSSARARSASARASSSTTARCAQPPHCATRAWLRIMINSNPETVSTDFDASSRLYFEPLDEESVRDVLDNETARQAAVLAQFGGQTAINLAEPLVARRCRPARLGTRAIDVAEDRDRFADLLDHLGIPQPPGGIVATPDEAVALAEQLGYPVLVRPSFVLGGRAMEICRNAAELRAVRGGRQGGLRQAAVAGRQVPRGGRDRGGRHLRRRRTC